MYILLGLIFILYFLPAMIALATRHPERSQIVLINLFLGWSIMFWVVSFRHAVGIDSLERENNKEQ